MSQVGNAERSAALFFYKNKENDYLDILRENEKTIKQTVIDYAISLAKRISLEDKDLEIKTEGEISGYIQRKLKSRCEWTENQIHHVPDYLEKYPQYKDKSHTPLSPSTGRLENLKPRAIEVLKILAQGETLSEIAKDDPEFSREIDKYASNIKSRNREAADDNNVAIVGHEERETKVSTWHPTPGKSEIHYGAGEVYNALLTFTKNWKGVVDKTFQFPPNDTEHDREVGNQLLAFAEAIDGLNLLLPPLKDEKWAFDKTEWWRTMLKEEEFSKHGAAVKSKVEIYKDGKPTGEFRPLTRERVGDVKEKLFKDLEKTCNSINIFMWIFGLGEWRNVKSVMSHQIAERRDSIHDKLSEKAIG